MTSITPKRYNAFLSYNSQDRPAVHEVAERLKGEALELYLEEWELAPGWEFQPALAEGLRDSKTCVVFLGPNGLGPWQKQEVQVAIDMRARDAAFHVIPVLLPGTERPRRGDVAHLEFLINASWVEFLTTLDDERAFRSLVWGITGAKPLESDATRDEGVCPYRGLEAFRPEDAQFFFGRANLTGWLVSALRREVRAAPGVRFLGVLGPSGSGKSSVVLAGLVPSLRAGAIEGSARWPVAILRPGDDPLKNLAAGVVPRFLPTGALPDAAQVLKLADDLRADARILDVFAQVALHDRPADVRLVVVVDQFEEVFTSRPQDGPARARFEQDRDQFFANLLNAAATPGGRVAVVLTMRSDFLSACAPFPQLSAVLSAHQELVGPMTPAELREAIERPAYLVGCEVEPRLTERLLADVEGQSGALPLLQFALTEAWKKREVRRLTLRAYTELGKDAKGEQRGIEGVLDHRANEIHRNLTPADQDLCRRLFLRLVQPGEGTEDTKRRVSYHELLPEDPARAEAVWKLVQTLAAHDARLITTEGTNATDGAVEVAHEALIRGWTQLRRWVDAERAGLRTHRRLTEAAQEWSAARPEHKKDFLYSRARLEGCREWIETHRDELNPDEAAFLAASEEAERQREQAERQREQAELEKEHRLREAAEAMQEAERKRAEDAEAAAMRQKRLGRRFLVAAVVAVVLAATSGGLAVWANLGRANTLIANAHGIRISRQPGQRFDALKALGEAVKIGRALWQPRQWFDGPRNEAVAALALPDVHITQSWPGFPPGTRWAEVSTDFTLYARTTETGSVSVRRVAGDVAVASLPPLGEPAIPAFGPGGLLVRYGAKSGRFQLWDIAGKKRVPPFQNPGPVTYWDFRPDGRLVLLTYRDASLGVVEVVEPGHFRFRHLASSGITDARPAHATAQVHPYEPVAVLSSYLSSTLQVLDLRTGEVLCSVHLPWRGSGECAWSPDGLTLVVPDGDNSGLMRVYAFDPAARALRGCDLRLMSSVNDVNSIPTEGKNLIIVANVQDVLHFRAFASDGKRVVDTDESQLPDKTPQLADETPQLAKLKSLLSDLWGVPELPQSDKERVISAVTSIVTLHLTRTIPGPDNGGASVHFNPAGDRFAVRGWAGIVRLYDAVTGRRLFSTLPLRPTSTYRIQFDPSGRYLAAARVGDSEDQIGVWSVADAREYRVLPRDGTGAERREGLPAIHPQGRLTAQSFTDGIALYDLETGRELKFIPIKRGATVCFDRAGNLLTNGFAGLFRWPVRPDAARPGGLTLGPPERLPFKPGNRPIATSDDGRVVAQPMYNGYDMGSYAGGWILHPDASCPRRIDKGTSMTWASVSPDGRWVAFGVHSERVDVYEAATGRQVWPSPADGYDYGRFSRDGRWLVTENDGGWVYAVGTWEPQARLGPGVPWDVSPDSSVVVLGMTNGVYRLVERATGRELVRLEDPDRVHGRPAVFTPDGTRLVVAAQDGLRLWDLRRVRAELDGLGLDWEQRPYPPASLEKAPEPLQVTVDSGELNLQVP